MFLSLCWRISGVVGLALQGGSECQRIHPGVRHLLRGELWIRQDDQAADRGAQVRPAGDVASTVMCMCLGRGQKVFPPARWQFSSDIYSSISASEWDSRTIFRLFLFFVFFARQPNEISRKWAEHLISRTMQEPSKEPERANLNGWECIICSVIVAAASAYIYIPKGGKSNLVCSLSSRLSAAQDILPFLRLQTCRRDCLWPVTESHYHQHLVRKGWMHQEWKIGCSDEGMRKEQRGRRSMQPCKLFLWFFDKKLHICIKWPYLPNQCLNLHRCSLSLSLSLSHSHACMHASTQWFWCCKSSQASTYLQGVWGSKVKTSWWSDYCFVFVNSVLSGRLHLEALCQQSR